MKKLLLILLFFLAVSPQLLAQDTITKKDGEAIKAKVLEITPGEIKYKKHENPTGPVYVLSKAEVMLIEYENKTKEEFSGESSVVQVTSTNENVNLYGKGMSDAHVYYRDYKGAGTGTLVATLLTPIGGLITAIACSSTPPKEHNLGYPDNKLMSDQNYNMGYRQQAKKAKSGKVWTNFGIGVGVNLAVILLLASQTAP